MSELNFVNNIAAGIDALGVRNATIVYGLARVDWETVEDRDAFLRWAGEDDGQ